MARRDVEDYIEIDGFYVHHTGDAVLIKVDRTEYWIPRSQISDDSWREIDRGSFDRGDKIKLEMTEWIATEKGLV